MAEESFDRILEASPTIGWSRHDLAPAATLLREVFAAGLAGLIAGVVFLGLGSRLVMRISALADPGAEGLATESGNVIGEVTLGGSVSLIAFVGLFGGLAAGVIWVLVRDWLPKAMWLRTILAAALAVLTGGFIAVSAENTDFALLRPATLNVAMFLAIVAMAGAATAAGERVLLPRLPTTRLSSLVYGVLAIAALAPVAPVLVGLYFFNDICDCEDPPRLLGGFLALSAAGTLLGWGPRLHRSFPARLVSLARPLGVAGVCGAAVFGGLHLAGELGAIL